MSSASCPLTRRALAARTILAQVYCVVPATGELDRGSRPCRRETSGCLADPGSGRGRQWSGPSSRAPRRSFGPRPDLARPGFPAGRWVRGCARGVRPAPSKYLTRGRRPRGWPRAVVAQSIITGSRFVGKAIGSVVLRGAHFAGCGPGSDGQYPRSRATVWSSCGRLPSPRSLSSTSTVSSFRCVGARQAAAQPPVCQWVWWSGCDGPTAEAAFALRVPLVDQLTSAAFGCSTVVTLPRHVDPSTARAARATRASP